MIYKMKINPFTQIISMVFLMIILGSCNDKRKPEIVYPTTDLAAGDFIPRPNSVVPTNDAFGLDQFTSIYTAANTDDYAEIGQFLAEKIKIKTGLRLAVNNQNAGDVDRVIYINESEIPSEQGSEAYQIMINRDSVIINAAGAEAAFRAIQTLRQAIPETSNDTLAPHPIWPIPTGEIEDAPFFEYRGSMLDVARHFFSVEEVKKYIDHLAYYKINVLHLHLTDDQGWRIEIKSWPKLTEVGGSTEVGGESGGFFTQEDYKEIVAYAAGHYITIVPEIDMPGHTNAASVSYPILDGTGKPLKPYEGTRVGFSTFDTHKDTVYSFIDDVVREVSAITPGPYFHIGGDESHATKHSDYVQFVNKVEKIVQKHGKRMIGWDEIATADVDSKSIAQFWASEDNATEAVEKGMKVIISPAKKAYLDMKYDTLSKHGLNWAAYIPVDTAYNWHPERYSPKLPKESILGVEAPLWSETISNSSELEYLAFPRIIGYSELSWSLPEHRNWEDFKKRLANHAPYLERMDINYYRSPLIEWKTLDFANKEMPKD